MNGKQNGSGRVVGQRNHVAIASAGSASTQGDMEHGCIVALPAARLPGGNGNGNGLPPAAWLVRGNGERIPLVRVDVKLVCDAE